MKRKIYKNMEKAKTIYLAILNQGYIRSELVFLLTKWVRESPYNLYLTLPAAKPIMHNRNNIVKKFLETDFDYLIMLDNDIIPPANFLTLVDYDKDIIGGLCFACKNRGGVDIILPLALEKKPSERDDVDWKYRPMKLRGDEGLVEVDAIGTGAIIIARRVLEHPKMKPAFVDYYDDDGLRIEGLDLSFCRRAKENGFKVYTHTDFASSHWTEMDLKQIYSGEAKRSDEIQNNKK